MKFLSVITKEGIAGPGSANESHISPPHATKRSESSISSTARNHDGRQMYPMPWDLLKDTRRLRFRSAAQPECHPGLRGTFA